MLGSLFGLASDVVKIVVAPVDIAASTVRIVTKPVSDAAEDLASELKRILGDD